MYLLNHDQVQTLMSAGNRFVIATCTITWQHLRKTWCPCKPEGTSPVGEILLHRPLATCTLLHYQRQVHQRQPAPPRVQRQRQVRRRRLSSAGFEPVTTAPDATTLSRAPTRQAAGVRSMNPAQNPTARDEHATSTPRPQHVLCAISVDLMHGPPAA